jgi:hypothetical protein
MANIARSFLLVFLVVGLVVVGAGGVVGGAVGPGTQKGRRVVPAAWCLVRLLLRGHGEPPGPGLWSVITGRNGVTTDHEPFAMAHA